MGNIQKFVFKCEVCGHEFRDDMLGFNLQSLNPARRLPAKARIKSPDAFHEYHLNHCAYCECCPCKNKK